MRKGCPGSDAVVPGVREDAELLIVVGHAAVADEDALDERWADALARGEDVAVEVPGVGHALEGGRHRGVRRVGERAGRVDVETGYARATHASYSASPGLRTADAEASSCAAPRRR